MVPGDAPDPPEPASPDAAAESEPEAVEANPLILLRVRLGLEPSAEPWLVRYLQVLDRFDAGDNRGTRLQLDTLLTEELPAPLRREALQLRKRLRPDPVALLVAALSAILLVAIWITAVSAG